MIVINEDCINCDMCVPECPVEAIDMGAEHYEINQALCVECEGYYDQPSCYAVCPVDAVDITQD
ncbi:MAG: ferredoxin [Idiomarina sp.]|jgi:ferredoxin|uniref:4Fe-4S binding protein n=1 Tax=Idiomarina sp. TaxID=1874361 RepID=UPI000C0E3DF6|nr:4Fe-4S binding protein [Idiomarina sp.]MBL4741501.1 4Fe-4S binding protein [Idiomarina sp.]MBT41461.1 ferredoxin [Idiomarina sp.]PHQ77860.1 MAG: ferredoxin [Idiomarina sp.]HAD49418.1 ferredoxin [Idiomarina sp.]